MSSGYVRNIGFSVVVVIFLVVAMMVPANTDAGCGTCQKCVYVIGQGNRCTAVSSGPGKKCCDDSQVCGTWGDSCYVGGGGGEECGEDPLPECEDEEEP